MLLLHDCRSKPVLCLNQLSISLCTCYAMPSTDTRYQAIRISLWMCRTMPGRASLMIISLCACYAMSVLTEHIRLCVCVWEERLRGRLVLARPRLLSGNNQIETTKA
eukprot:3055678-Rhodomonas_salina.4